MFHFLYIITAWTILFFSFSFSSESSSRPSFVPHALSSLFFFFSFFWHHHFRTGTVASPGTSLYSPFFGFRTHLLALSDTTSHSHGNISHLLARPAISTSFKLTRLTTCLPAYPPVCRPTGPAYRFTFIHIHTASTNLTYSSSYFLVTLVSKK